MKTNCCLLCHTEIALPPTFCVDTCNCTNDECIKHDTKYLISYDGEIREIEFTILDNNKTYLVSYTNYSPRLIVYERTTFFPIIATIDLSFAFDLILTPDNFEKKLPLLINFY